jgi:prevent-host-death family protein
MKYVGMRQLKTQLARYLRTVQAGESLTVTVRKRPVARVIPILPQGKEAEERCFHWRTRVYFGYRSVNSGRSGVLKIRNVRIADAVLEDRGATDA